MVDQLKYYEYAKKRRYPQCCPCCGHKWKSIREDVKWCPNCTVLFRDDEEVKKRIKMMKRIIVKANNEPYFCALCKIIHKPNSKKHLKHFHWRLKDEKKEEKSDYKRVKRYPQCCPHCGHKWKSCIKGVNYCPNCGKNINMSYAKIYFCTLCNKRHYEGSKYYNSHYGWWKRKEEK